MNMRKLTVFIVMGAILSFVSIKADSIPVANHSFESPEIDPVQNPFMAIPVVLLWTELDNDTEGSQNTGIFRNTLPGNSNHIVNTDANQAHTCSVIRREVRLRPLPPRCFLTRLQDSSS